MTSFTQLRLLTRTRLLEATFDCVQAFGLAACTTAHIAQAAQVGAGTLYRYFPTKEALLRAAFSHARTLLQGPLPAVPDEPTLHDLVEKLWRHAAHQAAKHPAAFHYWCQFGTTQPPNKQPVELGPFRCLPSLLGQASSPPLFRAFDAWLMTVQWTAALQFILGTCNLSPPQLGDTRAEPTPAQLLDRAYAAWWAGTGLSSQTVVESPW